MKKLIAIILLFFAASAYAQIDYPRYEKDSLGQNVVVMTIAQAQALDNATDLILLFEKLNSQIAGYDSVCVKVVSEKDRIIAEQTIQINKLKEACDGKDQQIVELKKIIDKRDETILVLDQQVKKSEEIELVYKKEVRRLKTKMIVGGSFGGLTIIGLIIGIIAIK